MSRTVRVDLEVRKAIAARALEGETPNATLRRLLELDDERGPASTLDELHAIEDAAGDD
jgi:DNA transposition AAA+ family ATPase